MGALTRLSATLTQIKVKREVATVSKYHVMRADRVTGCKAPQTGSLGTHRYAGVVNFTHLPLYIRRKNPEKQERKRTNGRNEYMEG
jgi:hypothetical protein